MREESRGTGSFLIYFILVLGVAGPGGLLWWLPLDAAQKRGSNERQAATTLYALSAAEADYRANDRDANGVNDFWTADVAGLYKHGLIPREIAEADAAPLTPLVPQPIPHKGYYFKALQQDDSVSPPDAYRQETDKTSGKVHHRIRFGFVAIPAEIDKSGKYYFIRNEYGGQIRQRARGPAPLNWPSDGDLRSFWVRFD
jgi:hypothetical protein